ncbi:MAG TPA: hypothetical protein VNM92_13045 [Thermoanaerobaculia bacterium]|nr:hypothetical protein [Thermoanaerobaculia bacterium]
MATMTPNNLKRSRTGFFPLRTLALSATFAALIVGVSEPSHATLARAVEFDAKVGEADAIILGECKSTRSQLDPSGKWIVTYSTFSVKKSFKGNSVGEVTVVTPGGHVGNLHQTTVGIPEFRQGDEKVLFVKQREIGSTILYADQGTYDVTENARGEKAIVPTESDLVVIDEQTGRATSGTESYRSVNSFESDVKLAMTRGQARNLQSTVGNKAVRSIQRNWLNQFGSFVDENKVLLSMLTLGLLLSLIPLIKRR